MHVFVSPLNDGAADLFKQATRSTTFHLLVKRCWSHWAGTPESGSGLWKLVCVRACMCECKCNVFELTRGCTRTLICVAKHLDTDACACVRGCTSVHMSALEFFCPAVWNTADVFSSPRGSQLSLSLPSLSSSPFIHTHPPLFIRHCSSDNKLTSVLIPLPSFGYIFTSLFCRSPSIPLYPSKHVTS